MKTKGRSIQWEVSFDRHRRRDSKPPMISHASATEHRYTEQCTYISSIILYVLLTCYFTYMWISSSNIGIKAIGLVSDSYSLCDVCYPSPRYALVTHSKGLRSYRPHTPWIYPCFDRSYGVHMSRLKDVRWHFPLCVAFTNINPFGAPSCISIQWPSIGRSCLCKTFHCCTKRGKQKGGRIVFFCLRLLSRIILACLILIQYMAFMFLLATGE